MKIDIESLKADLIDHFGTAVSSNLNAMADLIELDQASPMELINIALNNGFNLENYEVKDMTL